jgi:hypothetical protein
VCRTHCRLGVADADSCRRGCVSRSSNPTVGVHVAHTIQKNMRPSGPSRGLRFYVGHMTIRDTIVMLQSAVAAQLHHP